MSAPDKYPLLVKYIDAGEDLSIQVHPDDAFNAREGIPDRGKTECWFILDCEPGTEIVYGLKPGVDRSDLEHAIERKTVPESINRVPIHPGDFLFVPPGTVHAILGGTLLCEIQQSSNITFRLWDWDRKPERELHIEKSLEVIRFEEDLPAKPFHLGQLDHDNPLVTKLTDNSHFTVRAVQLPPKSSIEILTSGKGAILNGVGGDSSVEDTSLLYGQTLFVPASIPRFRIRSESAPATLLLTESNE